MPLPRPGVNEKRSAYVSKCVDMEMGRQKMKPANMRRNQLQVVAMCETEFDKNQ